MKLPKDHPQRLTLSNEVHARPPFPLKHPAKVSYLALKTKGPYKFEDQKSIIELAHHYGAKPPQPGAKHYSIDLGDFTLIWERHTEFSRYTFVSYVGENKPFQDTAIQHVPEQWVEDLQGELIVAAHVCMLEMSDENIRMETMRSHFGAERLIGSYVAGRAGLIMTDFKIHEDGFSRFYILNEGMEPGQAGRIVQRLLEIETYRMMALLALPVAQDLILELAGLEKNLSLVAAEMAEVQGGDEINTLGRLTTLQAAIERISTKNQFRFGASAAYYVLVQRRIAELRESRLPNIPTIQGFTERRLAPAMATCNSAERRLNALSERVDRSTQLLSTKVNLSLEQQNQAVLESMNKRAGLQVRLQQTVEGLSIAAITYYVVGVVGYVFKGMVEAGAAINSGLAIGLSVPIVLAVVTFMMWRVKQHVADHETKT